MTRTATEVRGRIVSICSFLGAMVFVNVVFFRLQIFNGFSHLFGGVDGVIETALLEHWYNAFRGLEPWYQVGYFFPYQDTLGYNDGYFLYGVVHSFFRMMGLDPLLSAELVNMAMKNLGFVAFFLALRRMLGVTFGWSLLAATLFTISNNSLIHAEHSQLFTIAFVPVETLLIYEFCRAFQEDHRLRLVAWGSLAGVCYSAWLMTAYYMAWFFLYLLTFFIAILCLRSYKFVFSRAFLSKVRENGASVAFVALVTLLCLIPFLETYLPKLHETGAHNYSDALNYTLNRTDPLNVGVQNYLFGALCDRTGFCQLSGEHMVGITPILLFIFALSQLWIWRCRHEGIRHELMYSFSFALLVTWFLCLRVIGRLSGWYVIYHLFPGAEGLRVVARYQIFLMAPVTALSIWFLSVHAQRVSRPVLAFLLFLLLLEQMNVPYVDTDRADTLARVGASAPPPECSSFYVSASRYHIAASEVVNANYPHNIDAMLIAELVHLPTLNGYATFNPPDWIFDSPDRADYQDRVKAYSEKHRIKGLCYLNLQTLEWKISSLSAMSGTLGASSDDNGQSPQNENDQPKGR